MTVDVVVPVYAKTEQTEDMARRSVYNLREKHGDTVRIIIIDNGADADRDFGGDVYERFETNRGYGGGVNAGLEHTVSDPVVVSSIDIFITTPFDVLRLASYANIAQGLISPNAHRVRDGIDTEELEQPDCDFWGGIFAMPRALFESLGGIDTENFPLRFGDTDFGVRAAKAGWPVQRDPQIVVQHHDPSLSTTFMPTDDMLTEWDRLFELHGDFVQDAWKAKQWR